MVYTLFIQRGVLVVQVQLKPWGNSQGIRFSKEFLNEAGFSVNETLTAEIVNGQIVLSRCGIPTHARFMAHEIHLLIVFSFHIL